MFCLKCGKKLPQHATDCPFCQYKSEAAHADNYTQQLGELGLFPEDDRFRGITPLPPEPSGQQSSDPPHGISESGDRTTIGRMDTGMTEIPQPDGTHTYGWADATTTPEFHQRPKKKRWLAVVIAAALCCCFAGVGYLIVAHHNDVDTDDNPQQTEHETGDVGVATETTSMEASEETSEESSLESEESGNTANTEDSAEEKPPGETIVVEEAINAYLETDTSKDGTSTKMADIMRNCFRHGNTIHPKNISVVDENTTLPAADDTDDTYILIDYKNRYSSSGTIPIEEINPDDSGSSEDSNNSDSSKDNGLEDGTTLDGRLTLKSDYNLTYQYDVEIPGKYFALGSESSEQTGGMYTEELKSGGSLVLIYLKDDDDNQGTYRLYYAVKGKKEGTASLKEIKTITILQNKSSAETATATEDATDSTTTIATATETTTVTTKKIKK